MGKKYTADTFEGAVTGTASGNVAKTGDTMTGTLTNTATSTTTRINNANAQTGAGMLSFQADSGSISDKFVFSRSGSGGQQAAIKFEETSGNYADNLVKFELSEPNSYSSTDYFELRHSSITSSNRYIKAHQPLIANQGIYLGTTSKSPSNHLDDYEEGTYNLKFYLGTGTTGLDGQYAFTTFNNSSKYVKVGRKVTLYVKLQYTGTQNVIQQSTLQIGMGNFPFTPITSEQVHGTYGFQYMERPNSSTIPQTYGWNGVMQPSYFGASFGNKIGFQKIQYNSTLGAWYQAFIKGNEFPRYGAFGGLNYLTAIIHYYTND